MADHLRTVIFAAIVAKLVEIETFAADGKVKRGRTRAIPQELLPAITPTWADDDERATVRPSSGQNGEDGYDRTLPISLIVHLRDADPEIEFDRLCVSIEAKMAEAIKLPGASIETVLQSTRFFVDRETGLPLMTGRLVYLATYKTLAADPTVSAL
jgi:hypothetical protein